MGPESRAGEDGSGVAMLPRQAERAGDQDRGVSKTVPGLKAGSRQSQPSAGPLSSAESRARPLGFGTRALGEKLNTLLSSPWAQSRSAAGRVGHTCNPRIREAEAEDRRELDASLGYLDYAKRKK